jgi:hypothetical protein
MGNKSNAATKEFFVSVGHGIEDTYHTVERAVAPITDKITSAVGGIEHRVEATGGKIWDVGDKIIDTGGNVVNDIGKVADSLASPFIMYALIGIGGLVALSILKK